MIPAQNILFTGCRIIDAETDIAYGWIMVSDGIISRFGEGVPELEITEKADLTYDVTGQIAMPGIIDTHVHFREPGFTHKADIASESRAAAAGGVTTFFDMPNTNPPTTSIEAWKDKMLRAEKDSLVNYAFFVGATPDNINWLESLSYTDCPGVKLFMGSTTGTSASASRLWLDDLFSRVKAIIAVHAEDDRIIAFNQEAAIERYGTADNVPIDAHPYIRDEKACIEATRQIISIAEKYCHRLHICHISTASEVSMLSSGKNLLAKTITAETCPQYLTFDKTDYNRLGARIKCNPSIKEASDRKTLEDALITGLIDTIATDHAPHLSSDKIGGALKATSGMPGVQFSLPLMLEKTTDGHLTLGDISRLMSGNPAVIFGIEQRGFIRHEYHADLVFVKKDSTPHYISDSDVVSKCGWTPYAGISLSYSVKSTWVNGICVYSEGKFPHISRKAAQPVKFKGSV